jgi:beta-xylosidase
MGRSKRGFAVALAAMAVVLAACIPEPPPPPAVEAVAPLPPPPPPPPPLPAAPGGVAAAAISPEDAPDPSVISVDPKYCATAAQPAPGACYFAYTTQVYLTLVPTWRSTDLVNWQQLPQPAWSMVMPQHASWTEYGHHWAPAVVERPANPPAERFVMWYTARSAAYQLQCLGVATAPSPAGPFVDPSGGPAYCQPALNGTIDPSPLVDADGSLYLTYRSDGVPGHLWSSRLSADGKSIAPGTEHLLLTGGAPDALVVEAPTMVRLDTGSYYVFYSTDDWWTANYRISVARCDGPAGPCSRMYSTALVGSRGSMLGPGGQHPFRDTAGNWHLMFHAWTAPLVDYPTGGRRMLRLLPLTFNGTSVQAG